MPLTGFQVEVLRQLFDNRSPESYIAGGIALNAAEDVRWSMDVDVFHDEEEAVIRASDADVKTLEDAGYSIQRELWTPGYRRAWINKGEDGVKLEWCRESAWRFFPIERDKVLGWRLHRFDALTNKALALAGRSETRDLVDLVANAHRYPYVTVIWAACAKDAGYSPRLLFDQTQRNARIDPAELREMGAEFDPVDLKKKWLRMADECEREIERAIQADIEPSLAFIDPSGEITWIDTSDARPHRATLGGALPRIVKSRGSG